MSRKDSLYLHLLKLLLLAAVVSILFYMILDWIGEYTVDAFYSNSDYVEQKNEEYMDKLQQYVKEKKLTSKDSAALTKWVTQQKIISIQIYKNNILMYDSDYPEKEAIWEENIESNIYDWGNSYAVKFADGTAAASIFGMYSYQFYTYITIIELMLSFLLYIIIALLGISKTIWYIRQLSEEIGILESGNLDYEITLSGHDELTILAQGLDDMRKSFRDQVEKEKHLVMANQRMITNMSHDLRTPLTSIMIYTELLKKGKYRDEKQRQEFIEKIDRKTHQMKQLADNLFEYSLITSEAEVELEKPESFTIVFYDLLSETCAYLEQRGFHPLLNVTWKEPSIRVNTDYLTRILDNITSNIIKYAAAFEPIRITSIERGGYIGFAFENKSRILKKKENSTNIGINNVKNMMMKMEGICEVEEKEERFMLTLLFKVQK